MSAAAGSVERTIGRRTRIFAADISSRSSQPPSDSTPYPIWHRQNLGGGPHWFPAARPLALPDMGQDATVPRELLDRLVSQIKDPQPERTGRTGADIALSERERQVLILIAEGHGNAGIAEVLNCSPHTVKNIIYDLMGRLQLRNRTHAAAFAVRAGLV